MHRPVVPERLRADAAVRRGKRVSSAAARRTVAVVGANVTVDAELRGSDPPVRMDNGIPPIRTLMQRLANIEGPSNRSLCRHPAPVTVPKRQPRLPHRGRTVANLHRPNRQRTSAHRRVAGAAGRAALLPALVNAFHNRDSARDSRAAAWPVRRGVRVRPHDLRSAPPAVERTRGAHTLHRRYRITTKDQRIAPFYKRSSGSAPGYVHGVRRAVESFDREEVQHFWKG